jgi:hypothetical protein
MASNPFPAPQKGFKKLNNKENTMFRRKKQTEWILPLQFQRPRDAIEYIERLHQKFSPEIMTGSNIFKMPDGIFITVFVFSQDVNLKELRKEAKIFNGKKFKIKGDFTGLKDYALWGIIGDAGILLEGNHAMFG